MRTLPASLLPTLPSSNHLQAEAGLQFPACALLKCCVQHVWRVYIRVHCMCGLSVWDVFVFYQALQSGTVDAQSLNLLRMNAESCSVFDAAARLASVSPSALQGLRLMVFPDDDPPASSSEDVN